MKSHVHFHSKCPCVAVRERNDFVCVFALVITATTATTVLFETTDLWI